MNGNAYYINQWMYSFLVDPFIYMNMMNVRLCDDEPDLKDRLERLMQHSGNKTTLPSEQMKRVISFTGKIKTVISAILRYSKKIRTILYAARRTMIYVSVKQLHFCSLKTSGNYKKQKKTFSLSLKKNLVERLNKKSLPIPHHWEQLGFCRILEEL